MITKGIVEEIIDIYSAKVRMPTLDAIEGAKEATSNKDLSNAVICSLPNASNIVNKGDIVLIGFEDNDLGKPIILGHLFKESKAETYIDLDIRKLKTNSTTVLYKDTTIGEVKSSDIQCLKNTKSNIQEQINNIYTNTTDDINLINNWKDESTPAINFAESEYQKSKNLLDVSKIINISEYNENTGSITFTSTSENLDIGILKNFAEVVAGGTYTFSYKQEGSDPSIYLFGSQRYLSNGQSITLTQADLDGMVRLKLSGAITLTINEMQIENGSVKTNFSKFEGLIVHNQNITRSKVLFDKDNVYASNVVKSNQYLGGYAYTDGLPTGYTFYIDTSKYKKLKFYITTDSIQHEIVVDKTLSSINTQLDTNFNPSTKTYQNFIIWGAYAVGNFSTEFKYYNYIDGTVDVDIYSRIVKIEGVY